MNKQEDKINSKLYTQRGGCKLEMRDNWCTSVLNVVVMFYNQGLKPDILINKCIN